MFAGPQIHCSIQLTGSHLLLWYLWSLDFTSFSFVLSHLIKCKLDLDTVHLASRYSLSIVQLCMVCGTSRLTTKIPVHHNALNFKFLQHLVNFSMFTVSVYLNCNGFSSFNVLGSLVTRLIASFCPIYLFYIHVLYRIQYTYKILIHCIISLYIQWNHSFQYIFYWCLHTLNYFTQISIFYFIEVSMGLVHYSSIPHTSYFLCGLFNSQILCNIFMIPAFTWHITDFNLVYLFLCGYLP